MAPRFPLAYPTLRRQGQHVYGFSLLQVDMVPKGHTGLSHHAWSDCAKACNTFMFMVARVRAGQANYPI
jgi:hypothetical protein